MLVLVVNASYIMLSVFSTHCSHFHFYLFLRNHNVDPNCCVWCLEMYYVCVCVSFLRWLGFEEFDEKLIDGVHSFPVIYNLSKKSYKDKIAKVNAWKNIVTALKRYGKFSV